MINKWNRALRFLKFTLVNIRPIRKALTLIIKKFAAKLFDAKFKNLNFLLVYNNIESKLMVNDIEQFTYLFNILDNEPFRVSGNLPTKPVIIDGGANIGATSIYYASKFPQAAIYAFEPMRENVALLKHNVASILNITIAQKALLDETKIIDFYISNCSRYHSTIRGGVNSCCEKVEAIQLAEWLSEEKLKNIDILKLNIEGAELKAIIGLRERIRDVGIIVCEFHPQYVNKKKFIEKLKKNKFKIIRDERIGEIVSLIEAHNEKYDYLSY